MKRKKALKKYAFVIDCGAIPNDVLVLINHTKKTAFTAMKNLRVFAWFAEAILKEDNLWKEEAATFYCEEDGKLGIAILLTDAKRDGRTWRLIVHESVHAMDYILNNRKAKDEPELMAYLTEYIYSEIVTKID